MKGRESAIVWTFPEAAEHLPGRTMNVFRLCEEYFVTLKELVHAWLSRGELDVERAKVPEAPSTARSGQEKI